MIALSGLFLAFVTSALGVAGLGMIGHMAAHMGAVAVAAPVLALAWPGHGRAGGPLGWATAEFVVVWAWHAPVLRALADMNVAVALLEQAMFLAVGIGLWRAALAHPAGGVAALLLTSMHMTLLGALIGLAQRPLYSHHDMGALADQQMAGVVMLLFGGVAYLCGGLAMLARLLQTKEEAHA